MTEVKRDALADFLSKHIKSGGAVRAHMAKVEPLFVYAERGRYDLTPFERLCGNALELKTLAHRIYEVIEQPVENVLPVSHSQLLRPTWSIEGATPHGHKHYRGWMSIFQATALSVLKTSIDEPFPALLVNEFGQHLKTGLVQPKRDALVYTLEESGLSTETDFGLELGLDLEDFKEHLQQVIVLAAFYYLGFALAGRQDLVNRLGLLMHLLRHIIPLGSQKHSQNYLVLCG